MALAKVIEEVNINNVNEFVDYFGLQKEFKKAYKCDIDDWEFDVSDEEVIEKFLKRVPGKWVVTLDVYNVGSFTLYNVL